MNFLKLQSFLFFSLQQNNPPLQDVFHKRDESGAVPNSFTSTLVFNFV